MTEMITPAPWAFKHAEIKSHPERTELASGSFADLTVIDRKLGVTGDRFFTSQVHTELNTKGERVPSTLAVSQLGQQIIGENPGLVDQLFSGTFQKGFFPDGTLERKGSDSHVTIAKVKFQDQEKLLAVKVHDEGKKSDDHGGYKEVIPDHVTGIDSFVLQRGIDLFHQDERVTVAQPVMATNRLIVSEFIENGKGLRGSEIPKDIKNDITQAVEKVFEQGWMTYDPRMYKMDLETSDNIIFKDGLYYVVDPVTSKGKRINELLASFNKFRRR